MKLKKITLKNIRSYEDQEIYFPEGSVLLSGDIGSGKTTILLAIEYALFGLQPGQRGSSLLRNSKSIGEVSLVIEVQGKEVIIDRKLKKSSKSVTNDYAAITIDGIKYESSITEVKTKILTILGYPQEFLKKNNILFRYTIYTPQEQLKQIILEEPESRLNVLRHVFGVEKYKRIRENTSVLISKLKEDSKFLQLEISSIEKDKEVLEKSLNDVKDLSNRLPENDQILERIRNLRKIIESELVELEKEIKEKERIDIEIGKTKILATSKREFISSISKDILELERAVSETDFIFREEELEIIENEIKSIKEILEEKTREYYNIESSIISFDKEVEDISKKRDKISRIDLCPTCLQSVSENYKSNIINELDVKVSKSNKNVLELKIKKEEFEKILSSIKSKLNDLEKKKGEMLINRSKIEYLQKTRNKLEELKKSKENIEKDISMLTSHIDNLKESSLSLSVVENKYKTKKEEFRKCQEEEKKVEIKIAEIKKEIEIIGNFISSISDIISKKEESTKKLSNLNELIDWLSTQFLNLIDYTERSIMLNLRKEFSRLFSKWFNMLAGEGFEVQLDESFTPVVIQGGVEMEYSFLSGGERTAVALAYRLSLNQIINSIFSTIKTKQIIILDEPTEGLSETQIDKMREIFEEINSGQLIIVSHEQKIESFVDTVLRVKKSEGISSVFNIQDTLLPKDLNTSPVLEE